MAYEEHLNTPQALQFKCEHPEHEHMPKTLPNEDVVASATEFFKIFADNTRLRILFALEGRELCVHSLTYILSMNKSAISHQLKILRQANLVRSRKDGKHVFYRLSDDHIKEILDTAMEHIRE